MLRSFCLALVAGASLPLVTILAAEAPVEPAAVEKPAESGPLEKAAEKVAETPAEPAAAETPELKATCKAIDEIGKLGEAAKAEVPALLKCLADKQETVRWHAARALGGIGPVAVDAVPALTQALDDEAPRVRAYAAFALGQIDQAGDATVEQLIEAVFDKDEIVRRAASRALREIAPGPEKTLPVLEKILEAKDPAAIQPALAMLAEQGQKAVPRLQQFLKRPKLAYWACLVLAELGPDAAAAVPDLVAVLQSEDPQVRLQALIALGNMSAAAKSAVPEIVGLLEQDAFEGVRYAAVFALVQLGEQNEKVNAALAAAAEHKDPLLKLLGLWGLAKLNPTDQDLAKAAAEVITANLGSPDKELRQAAARALREFRAPPEIIRPALIAALQDADSEVVNHALEALASLGPQVLANIEQPLLNKDLRHHAAHLVYLLGAKGAVAVPALVKSLQQPLENEDDFLFRRQVQFTLAALGPAAKEAIPELINSLGTEDDEVFTTACYALGNMGPLAREAVPRLRKELDERQDSQRAAAVWALLKIMPNSAKLKKFAAPLLIACLNSEHEVVRAECAAALGDLGEPSKPAVPQLKQLLQDENALVREAAAAALKKLGESE